MMHSAKAMGVLADKHREMTERWQIDEAEALLNRMAEAFLASDSGAGSGGSITGLKDLDFEARYQALVEGIPAVVFVAPLGIGKGDAYVSPQIEAILGFTQEEWLEDPLRWYQQVHADDKQRWSVEAASLFSTGAPLSSNYRVMARDGRVVWFQCDVKMVLGSDGTPSFIHGIGFDVSALKETEASLKNAQVELEGRVAERTRELGQINLQLKAEIEQHKRMEEELRTSKEVAEQATRVKAEFLANMSHEIRTPMNGVLGLTNLVLETELNAEQREYLSTAYSSAQSLLAIINEVLDFSKLEAGRLKLDVATFNIKKGLSTLVRELEQIATTKSLDLTCHFEPGLPEFLSGDLGKLRQVLTNLIGNAIKFTQKGGVRLEVALISAIDRECTLSFSVIDNGIGIPRSKTRVIFEPFMQADGSVTREYGGTGLGLALSKNLVELMGGRLEVSSEPGLGSTFSFTTRFGLASAPVAQVKVADQTRRGRALRVLVAEDNHVNQKVVSRLLEKSGHTVTLAQNGKEALDAFCSASPGFEIILMDVQMPVMDGLSATQAIRGLEAETGDTHIPIIGLTAHAMASDRSRCLRAGMDGYLSKPFNADDLGSLIEEMTSPAQCA